MAKTDLTRWLEEGEVAALPALGTIAAQIDQALSGQHFSAKKEALADQVSEAARQLARLDTLRRKLLIRSFFHPGDRGLRDSLAMVADYLPGLLCEYRSLFSQLAAPAMRQRTGYPIDSRIQEGASRLARTYKKELLPALLDEKNRVADQLKRLDELSLSTICPATVKGEARRMLQSVSRDRRMRAYRSLMGRMVRYRGEVQEAFVGLHELRRGLADQAGFTTYYDYSLARSGLTEKTRSAVTGFRRLVERHLAPLTRSIRQLQWERLALTEPKPWDVMFTAPFGLPALDPSACPLEDRFLSAMDAVWPSQEGLLRSMKEEGALVFHQSGEPQGDMTVFDCCIGDARQGLASAYFPGDGRSFLLLPQVPQEWFAATAFAQAGSLLLDQATADPLPCPLVMAGSGLLRSTARRSMVLLSSPSWGHFYGNLARYAREYHLMALALELPLLCALDEMEEFLSRARVTNLKVFDHAWEEIADRYQLSGGSEDIPALIPRSDLWLYAPTLWSHPMTGIFEALATVTVLGTLPLGRRHQVLELCFARLLEGDERADALDRLISAGYPSPYEEETVMKASFAIMDYLGL